MRAKRVQIDNRRLPEEWILGDARKQWAAIEESMEWRKTHGRPFNAMALIARAVLATWEVSESKLTAKRKKELLQEAKALTEEWDVMRGIPMVPRSLEHRGMLAVVAWAIKMLFLALEKAT